MPSEPHAYSCVVRTEHPYPMAETIGLIGWAGDFAPGGTVDIS
jgi:hypothetical protein